MDSVSQDPFVALYEEHQLAVRRYAARRVDPHLVDDVVAEVFLVALRRPAAVPDEPLPWLYGVARHVIANVERSRRRAGRLDSRLRLASRWEPAAQADVAGGVAERLVALQALSAMSERDREVLMLVAWEGLDTKEVARALGCTATAAAVRLHRARRRLSRALGATTRPRDASGSDVPRPSPAGPAPASGSEVPL